MKQHGKVVRAASAPRAGKRVQDVIEKINPAHEEMDFEEFALQALEVLPEPPYPMFHCVWSGFNDAARVAFPDVDPCQALIDMGKRNLITVRPFKGGALIGPPK